MFLVFLAANAVRWWVIRTLGEHWNVQVMDSTRLGVVTSGPFRYVRHPNYAAVFAEMLALPLIHTAWITAMAGSLRTSAVLAQRLSTEERVLFANPDYRAAMTGKPRFLAGTLLIGSKRCCECAYANRHSARRRAVAVRSRAPALRACRADDSPAFITVPELTSGFHSALRAGISSRPAKNFSDLGIAASRRNRSAKSPSRPAISSRSFTVRACSPAISS